MVLKLSHVSELLGGLVKTTLLGFLLLVKIKLQKPGLSSHIKMKTKTNEVKYKKQWFLRQ